MKPLAFFVTALIILAGTSGAADDLSNRNIATSPTATFAQKSASDSTSEEKHPMTAKQVAEMRAQILMARKDYTDAVVAYQRLLEQDPRNTDMLNQVGIGYQQLGQVSLAERFYRKALSVNKKQSQVVNNLGTIEQGRGRYGKAIKDYKKAISMGGDDLAPIYANLGYAYCAINAYPKATEAFNSALAIDPTIFETRSNAGSIMLQRTAVDQAQLYFVLAKSYAKMGDAERTARYLKLARDDGYKDFRSAEKDAAFAKVIKDQRVQDVLRVQPAYAESTRKPATN
jgi:tetratricopeptide (TPR) repeat protein